MAYNSSCYFNCSEPPDHLSPYPDITGIGVLIGYTATAGIVVLILVFHYHLAHDPTKDPFRKDDDIGTTASRNPRPNPIDVLYLRLSSKVAAWLRFSPKLPKAKTYPRLEEVFTKCVQSMSDLQIVTGISILISGYVQLRCGLSVFHWQIIVLLAWFSSVTHLSCPTFLRNHLYNRPTERGWRLVTMGLMLSMLLVAMVPTGGYNWSDTSLPPAPYDHAVCYLRPNFYYTTVQAPTNDVAMTFWTMVISIVLLTLGFIYRIIRLHRSLSVSVVGRARTACSKKARCFLRLVYTKTNMETSGLTFKRTFLYRPLLALFLTARAILDLWNSMFVEILWMVGSFSWGLIRLLRAIQVEDRGSSDWSFGQVVPLVLLAAPLLTIFETFFKAQKPANTLSTAIAQFHTGYSQLDDDKVSSNTPLQARDHPDYDFYRDSSWTHKLIYFMVAYAFGVTATILTFGGVANSALLRFFIPSGAIIISYLPIYLVLTIWMFIMISILLEDISCAQGNVLRFFMGIKRKRLIQGFETMFFCYSLSCTIFNFLSFVGEDTLLMFLGASTVTYCMLSIMVSCVRRQHGNVF